MMRALTAAALLLALGACGANTPPPVAQPASPGKQLPAAPPPPRMPDEGVACAADVKQCRDGSYVSRNPAQNCAFDACTGENP
jgi:hypothetical protein